MCYRLLLQIKLLILNNGNFEFPMKKYQIKMYKKIKNGNISEYDLFNILLKLYKQVIYLKCKSNRIDFDK